MDLSNRTPVPAKEAKRVVKMTANEKRPKRAFTPGDKVEAIQRVIGGESKASVARNIGVPESTLRGWCKKENKLHYIAVCRSFFPETDKSNGAEIPEERARTETPTVAPRSSAATGLDLSSLQFESQSSQPATVSIDSPIELTNKRKRKSRQDLGASVSMSANSPLFGHSLPGPSAHTNLGTHSNNIATNLWPAHNGMLNLSETRHSGRSNHTSHPYRYSSSRSNQPSTSQAPSAQPPYDEETKMNLLRAQWALLPYMLTAMSYPIYMDYTTNLLIQQYYKQLNGPVPWPNDKLRSASQVTKEQSADNILYSHSTNHTRRSKVSATVTSPQEHVVQPAISPEVEIENIEPPTKKQRIVSGRSHPRWRNVLDNLVLNNFGNTTTEYANVIGSTNGESQEGYAEALEYGDKFLAWLESSRDPPVTHSQLHRLRGLLHNLRTRRGLRAATSGAHQRK